MRTIRVLYLLEKMTLKLYMEKSYNDDVILLYITAPFFLGAVHPPALQRATADFLDVVSELL